MKRSILFFAIFVKFNCCFAQAPISFYLNHGAFKISRYTNDAFYFLSNSNVLDKVDYQGNPIWSKSLPSVTEDFLIQDQNIYSLSDTILVKLDTAGNFIWAYDFSAPLFGTHYPLGIASDKNHIYVFSSTSPWGWGAGLITLDTSGNLVNSWCDFGGDPYIDQGFQRLNGGSWFLYRDFGTGSSYAWLVRADTLGNLDGVGNCIDQNLGVDDNVLDVIPLPDSSYISLNNIEDNWGVSSGQIMLSRFTDNGSILWGREFALNTKISVQSMGVDSAGNIYIIGEVSNDFTNPYYCSLKIDMAGNLIHANKWTDPTNLFHFDVYSRMAYQNGYMFFPFNLSGNKACVMALDTSLVSVCPIATAIDTPSQNSFLTDTSTWGSVAAYSYTMVNYLTTIQSHTLPITSDLCLLLSADKNENEYSVYVYPNPVSKWLTIQGNQMKGRHEVRIYNSIGSCFLEKSDIEFPIKVDVQAWSSGMYFVKIQNEKGCHMQKIVVE